MLQKPEDLSSDPQPPYVKSGIVHAPANPVVREGSAETGGLLRLVDQPTWGGGQGEQKQNKTKVQVHKRSCHKETREGSDRGV